MSVAYRFGCKLSAKIQTVQQPIYRISEELRQQYGSLGLNLCHSQTLGDFVVLVRDCADEAKHSRTKCRQLLDREKKIRH